VCLQHPRRFAQTENYTEFHKSQAQKATNIASVIDHFKLSNTSLVAHSEGAINAVIYALENADKVKNLILVAPAGIYLHTSMPSLLKNLATKVAVDGRRVIRSKHHFKTFRRQAKNASKY